MSSVLDVSETADRETLPKLPDRYEIVNGEVQELPPMSFYATEVANHLRAAVDRYLLSNDIGRCRIEPLLQIPQKEDRRRNRRPDLAFISYDRWPRDRMIPFTGSALDAVPDIAGEVASPGDAGEDLLKKVREYLRGGVRLVWVVYPLTQEVHAYSPGANQVRVYSVTDELDAGDIMPGFHTSVASLFPPTVRPPLPDDDAR